MKIFHVRLKLQAPGKKPGYKKGIAAANSKLKAQVKVLYEYNKAIKEDEKLKDITVEIVECKELRSDFIITTTE